MNRVAGRGSVRGAGIGAGRGSAAGRLGARRGSGTGRVSGAGRGTGLAAGLGAGRRAGAPLELSGGLASTVALGAVTLVTGIGMGRLFQGASYLAPILSLALLSHGLAYGLRRAKRFPPLLVAPLSIIVFVLASTWLVFPQATAAGLPDLHTVAVISRAVGQARVDFTNLTTPVPATPGFLWLAALAIGAAGTLADAAAFRLGAPIEGILPAFTVFLVTAGLGTTNGRLASVAIWLAAVLAYLLVVEVERRSSWAVRAGSGQGSRTKGGRLGGNGVPVQSLFSTGVALASVAVLGALALGPLLPGVSSASPLTRTGTSAGSLSNRVTVSPLVSIKAELLKPSSATVFTVASPVPRYWRLTALDSFNGTSWSADAAYQPAGTALPHARGPEATTSATQVYKITGLDEDWLPAAYLPVALSGTSAGYNEVSGSLIAPQPTYQGLTYEVTSQIPNFTPAQLASAQMGTHGAGGSQDLGLPASFPPSVTQLAEQVTSGASTPYAKALALQNFFREKFAYSLNVPASNSDNSLVTFLFDTKAGFCQQFAGAYAAMARAVGLPSRVAVGFTPGQLGADGLYHVEALDAHAWPEVELGQYGWVAFEPTPGRGQPGAISYTGVAPAQATSNPTPAAQNAQNAQSATAPTSATSPVTTAQPSSAPRAIPKQGSAHKVSSLGILAILGLALAGLVVLLAAATGLAVALGAARRRRRWAESSGPDLVLVAFAEATRHLGWFGRPRHPSETALAYAQRLAPDLPPGAVSPLLSLARQAEQAAYAPRDAGRPDAESWASPAVLREMSGAIGSALLRSVTPRRRLLYCIDPRCRLGRRRVAGWVSEGPGPLVRDPLQDPASWDTPTGKPR
ncbi:MAG: transglutaminase TgpA family protein [Acidimicrobiales bacterium]